MRIKFTSYILVVVLFLGYSCQTLFRIPAATSPSITLDDQPHRIAFINRYDYTVTPYLIKNENKNEVLENGARQLINSLDKSFAEDSWLELVLADTLARGLALTNFPELLMPSFIVSTCKLHDVDLLLLLEFFNASFTSETETIEYDDGDKSNTNYVDLVVEAGFSLYQSDGVLISRNREKETISYQERPALTSWVFIGPSMGKAGDEVSELAATLGYNYINNFYPVGY
jgi:hypothetical protein